MAKVFWENVEQEGAVYGTEALLRAKVPGGWLVRLHGGYDAKKGIVFVPDADHKWE